MTQLGNPVETHFAHDSAMSVDDDAKLDGLVDAMARCMAKLLFVDDEQLSTQSFGKVQPSTLFRFMHDELNYVPDRETLDFLEGLYHELQAALCTVNLATLIMYQSQKSRNVQLYAFARHCAYTRVAYYSGARDGDKMLIGGLRLQMYHEVKKRAVVWLSKCDSALCASYGQQALESDSEQVTEFVERFATAVARRLTNFDLINASEKPDAAEHMDDMLSPVCIEVHVRSAIRRAHSEKYEGLHAEATCLCSLNELAKADESRARLVLETERRADVLHVLRSPPVELSAANGGWCERTMNFALLERALSDKVPIEVSIRIAMAWAHSHGVVPPRQPAHSCTPPRVQSKGWTHTCTAGECVQNAVASALGRLHNLLECNKPMYVEVVADEDEVHTSPSRVHCSMPKMGFLCLTKQWAILRATKSSKKACASLDKQTRRIVRIGCLMLRLASRNVFLSGVVNSVRRALFPRRPIHPPESKQPRPPRVQDTAHTVALDAAQRAEYLVHIIELERKKANIGCRLLWLKEDVDDRSSRLAQTVDNAVCEIGAFSAHEVDRRTHTHRSQQKILLSSHSDLAVLQLRCARHSAAVESSTVARLGSYPNESKITWETKLPRTLQLQSTARLLKTDSYFCSTQSLADEVGSTAVFTNR